MGASFIQLPLDGAGKELQTWVNVISGQTVHAEAMVIVDSTGIEKGTAGNPFTVTINGTPTVSVTGNVGVTQQTSPWVDNITQIAGVTLGATAVVNFGSAPAAAAVEGVNASLFSGTTGLTNTGSALDVNLKTSSITLNVSVQNATIAVTQSGSPWGMNLTQVAGVTLGATGVTTFGTAPAAANVPGANVSLFSGTTGLTNTGSALDVNLKTSSITLSVTGTVTANQGGAPWTVKPDGTVWSLSGTSANVNVTNASLAVTFPASPIVWIEGHAGAVVDGTAGSPSTGVLTVQGVASGTAIAISGSVSVTGNPAINIAQVNGNTAITAATGVLMVGNADGSGNAMTSTSVPGTLAGATTVTAASNRAMDVNIAALGGSTARTQFDPEPSIMAALLREMRAVRFLLEAGATPEACTDLDEFLDAAEINAEDELEEI